METGIPGRLSFEKLFLLIEDIGGVQSSRTEASRRDVPTSEPRRRFPTHQLVLLDERTHYLMVVREIENVGYFVDNYHDVAVDFHRYEFMILILEW